MNITNSISSSGVTGPTFMWCVLMPSIHLFSLFSNILCIIVFCSKTFIYKPIAIYFICLLLSDSITLLIGYTEMIDRESHMMDKAFPLCRFNEKVTHLFIDHVYPFMDRLCLEWMLYKVLWTRVSTVLLAILSIQRCRTFFSLSYRETRVCAYFACLLSIFLAFTITCLEWVRVHCNSPQNPHVYKEIFHTIMNESFTSKKFIKLFQRLNASEDKYPCIKSIMPINSMLNVTTVQVTVYQKKKIITSYQTRRH